MTYFRKCKGGSLDLESAKDMLSTAVRTARRLNLALAERLREDAKQRELDPDQPLLTFIR